MIDPDELAARLTDELDERLADADAALATRYPGERAGRQPVHTAYVPADRYGADTARRWGQEALALLDEHADKFATVVADADIIRRVKAKLADEPVEDLRIDFEDGYVGPAVSGVTTRRTATSARRRTRSPSHSRARPPRRSPASGSSPSRSRPAPAACGR